MKLDVDPKFNAEKVLATATKSHDRVSLILAISGIVGPILFVTVLSILGILRPGYSALMEPASNLGVGWNLDWVMNTNFAISGVLLVASTVGFYSAIRRTLPISRSLKVGLAFLFVSGASLAIESFNQTDIPGFPPKTIHGAIHDVAFFCIFFSLVFGPIIVGRWLKNFGAWRRFGLYSILTGIVTLGLILMLFFASANFPVPPGLNQRILVAFALGWYVVLGSKLLTISKAVKI